MKSTIILLLFLLVVKVGFTQELKPDTIIKANHISYVVKQFNSGNLAIRNSENTYQNKHSNQPEYLSVKQLYDHRIANTFKQIFNIEKLQELAKDPRAMLITYFVSPTTGKTIELSFFLPKNMSLSIVELESLENALKANLVFKFNQNQIKNSEFLTFTESVHFKHILDGTLIENW